MMPKKDAFKDLNVTPEEAGRIAEALKQPEFRRLFAEYAAEISSPEARQRQEEEIAALEAEQGSDVKFLHPVGAWVLKASLTGEHHSAGDDSRLKVFVNVSSDALVDKPKCSVENKNGKRGSNWSVPHAVTAPQDESDKKGRKCRVIDIVFHPDTITLAERDSLGRFQTLVDNVALEAAEKSLSLKFDRNKIKRLRNIKYKGTPRQSIIRRPLNATTDLLVDSPGSSTENPVETKLKSIVNEAKGTKKGQHQQTPNADVGSEKPKPRYTIVHSHETDIQDFAAAVAPSVKRPRNLRVTIYFDEPPIPSIDSVADIQLDVFERTIHVQSESFELNLSLPFPIDETNSSAKFMKKTQQLTITMPVIPAAAMEPLTSAPQCELVEELESNEPTQKDNTEEMDENAIDEASTKIDDHPIVETVNADHAALRREPGICDRVKPGNESDSGQLFPNFANFPGFFNSFTVNDLVSSTVDRQATEESDLDDCADECSNFRVVFDPPTADESSPTKPSILKGTTLQSCELDASLGSVVSEASGATSPTRPKSVSFNEKVDQLAFCKFDPAMSIDRALRNRKKKSRRRIQGRLRDSNKQPARSLSLSDSSDSSDTSCTNPIDYPADLNKSFVTLPPEDAVDQEASTNDFELVVGSQYSDDESGQSKTPLVTEISDSKPKEEINIAKASPVQHDSDDEPEQNKTPLVTEIADSKPKEEMSIEKASPVQQYFKKELPFHFANTLMFQLDAST